LNLIGVIDEKCVEADFFWLDIEGFETGLDQHLFAVKMEQPFF
jgi:hypothetical protein